MRRHSRRRFFIPSGGVRGFTLLELMIGLGIFATIALTLYSTFSNGIRLSRDSQDMENVYRDARWIFDALTADLENMVSYTPAVSDADKIHRVLIGETTEKNIQVVTGSFAPEGGNVIGLRGDERNLALVLPTAKGLRVVQYFLEDPERTEIHDVERGGMIEDVSEITLSSEELANNQFLIRSEESLWKSSEADNGGEGQAGREVLSPFIYAGGLKFSYARLPVPQSTETDIQWEEEWEEPFFPAGVRVEMQFVIEAKGQEKIFPLSKDIFIPRGAWGPLAPEMLAPWEG